MIELIILFCFLIIPWAVFGLWWWFWLFVGIAVLVGVVEFIAKIKTGQTISQMFHTWSVENKSKAWLVIGCLGFGWLVLIFHLAKGIF